MRISTLAFVHLICILNWIIECSGGNWIKGCGRLNWRSKPHVVCLFFYPVAICQIESKTSVVVSESRFKITKNDQGNSSGPAQRRLSFMQREGEGEGEGTGLSGKGETR